MRKFIPSDEDGKKYSVVYDMTQFLIRLGKDELRANELTFKIGKTTATALVMTARLLGNENEYITTEGEREKGPLFERNTTAVSVLE